VYMIWVLENLRFYFLSEILKLENNRKNNFRNSNQDSHITYVESKNSSFIRSQT
jgi:hypothetical protein